MDQDKDKELNLYKENYLLNSVFVKDTEFQYIYKKTEKIVTAIFLVTNFMTKEEPLKWSLRNSSTDLLKSVMAFSKMSLSDRELRVHEINAQILETSSFFDLAFRSGFVSLMNYNIINFEISKLSVALDTYQKDSIGSNSVLFDSEYFKVHKADKSDFNEKDNVSKKDDFIKDIYKGHTTDKGHNGNDLYKTNKFSNNIAIDDDIKDKPKQNTLSTQNQKPKKRKTNTERRNVIISEIKKFGDVSIKEITRALPTVSSKTLQRELLSMVDDGLLVKKGERRWSRYSLK
jgi:hypothetical protein